MIAERLIRSFRTAPPMLKLIAGSVVVALGISLGMVAILKLLSMEVTPALPSSLAAIGAALFAARIRLKE